MEGSLEPDFCYLGTTGSCWFS